MATRKVTFEVTKGIRDRLGYRIVDISCGNCGGYVGSRFKHVCPVCQEEFTEDLYEYVEKEQ